MVLKTHPQPRIKESMSLPSSPDSYQDSGKGLGGRLKNECFFGCKLFERRRGAQAERVPAARVSMPYVLTAKQGRQVCILFSSCGKK